MDAEKMRERFNEIRDRVDGGEQVTYGLAAIFRCPEGHGYFVTARGLTWHRVEFNDAFRLFVSEVRTSR